MYGGWPLMAGNQLEWILSQYARRKGVRRSLLQATTFDPQRDHTASARLGFPCLQHVSFEPTKVGLVVNAFYATQQIFDKAYGNYLGLAQLGGFMAHEMNLPFSSSQCHGRRSKPRHGSRRVTPALVPIIVDCYRR